MAERLTAADARGDFGNISQATILNFVQEYRYANCAIDDAKNVVKHATESRKDLRKRIKDSGIRLDVFDRAYTDAERSQDDRDEEERQYRYLMACLGREAAAEPADAIESPEHLKLRIDAVRADGRAAGRSGYDASTNPHKANSTEWVNWLDAWSEGQSAKVFAELDATLPPQDKRRARAG